MGFKTGLLQNQTFNLLRSILYVRGSQGVFKSFLQTSTLKILNRGLGKVIPFSTRNGLKILKIEPDSIQCKIALKGNQNHFGAMYAGAIFTVAEMPVGILALFLFDAKFYPILKSMNVDFIKIAQTDVTIEYTLSQEEISRIEKEAEQKGKCDFTLKGELKDQHGNIVAQSNGVYQIRKREKIQ